MCPSCKTGRLGLKVSIYGGFIGCSNYKSSGDGCSFSIPLEMCFSSSKATIAKHAFEPGLLGSIGQCEDTGTHFHLKLGPFGYYIATGDSDGDLSNGKRTSLPKAIAPNQVRPRQPNRWRNKTTCTSNSNPFTVTFATQSSLNSIP